MKTPAMRDSTYKPPPHLVFSIHLPLLFLLSFHYSLSPSLAIHDGSGVNTMSQCMSKMHTTVLHYEAVGVCRSEF